MNNFDPKTYDMVEVRIARLYERYPDARIITQNLTTQLDRDALTWVIRAEIWLPMWSCSSATFADGTTANYAPEKGWFLKSTGHAFEIDGSSPVNKKNALENAETSAIGRALANMGLLGRVDSPRPSETEMAKARDGVAPARDWIAEADAAKSIAVLRKLYSDARKAQAPENVLKHIAKVAEEWTEPTE